MIAHAETLPTAALMAKSTPCSLDTQARVSAVMIGNAATTPEARCPKCREAATTMNTVTAMSVALNIQSIASPSRQHRVAPRR